MFNKLNIYITNNVFAFNNEWPNYAFILINSALTSNVSLFFSFIVPFIYAWAFFNDLYFELINYDVIPDFLELTLMEYLVFLFTWITAFLCFFLFNNEVSVKRNQIFVTFIYILLMVLFLSQSNTIISFFFYYELLLLASVYLVWLSSPNSSSKYTAFYFLFWTQFGSFLVFIGVLIFYWFFDSDMLFLQNYCLYNNSLVFNIASYLIFIGFSVNVPLWPFHFWLTNTHVEASTAFSIFLSGILVNTAVLGLINFNFIFMAINQYFIFFILGYGILDASLNLYSQVDLNKLIAYTTVQEMSIMVLLVVFDSFFSSLTLIYFCFFHTIISGLFFYINDVLYNSFGTRHISNITGLVCTSPSLAFFIVVASFLFIGLPFTIKFYIEIQILYNLFFINPMYTYLFIFIVQYISILFFFNHIVSMVFGPIQSSVNIDLTSNELSVFTFFMSMVLILSIF